MGLHVTLVSDLLVVVLLSPRWRLVVSVGRRRDAEVFRRRRRVSGGAAGWRRVRSSVVCLFAWRIARGGRVVVRLLRAAEQERMCEDRRSRGWGKRLIEGEKGQADETVWRALRREGISRTRGQQREQPRCCEWHCNGDVLRRDGERLVSFSRTGDEVTGDSYGRGAEKRMQIGLEWVGSLVDDHSRLAYGELGGDKRAAKVTGFVERGLAFYERHGIEPQRLISDKDFA